MLKNNDLLKYIAEQLKTKEPNREWITERLKLHPLIEKIKCDGNLLFSLWSEIHLRVALEDICRNAKLKGRVIFDPIKNNEETKNYAFEYDYGRFIAFDKRLGDCNSEYDTLAVVDSIPTIFEIKLETNKKGINELMEGESIKRIASPILEYFNSEECGLVLVTHGCFINPTNRRQSSFLERGGIIAPINIGYRFWLSRWEKITEVKKIKQEMGYGKTF